MVYPLRIALAVLLLPSIAAARDNILVIIGDDMGVDQVGVYSDDVAYGHLGEGATPPPTPNIDALAAEGILFRHAYTNPICSPTRAQILTGRHGFRTEIGFPVTVNLDTAETTIPELLSATHSNAALGKWHLGPVSDLDHPIDSGFSYYAGSLGGGVSDYESWPKTTASDTVAGTTQTGFSTYATTDTVNEALAKITEFGEDQWFVWVAFNAPHSPFHVPPSELTTIAVDGASDTTTKYQAAVEAMDTEIGRLLAGIPAPILADTTIVFLGDNGTPGQAVQAPFNGARAKGTMYEGGINVPLIVAGPWVDAADEGKESTALIATVDLTATVADIAGIPHAAEDSLSFLPYLLNPDLGTQPERPYVYNERFEPNGPGLYTDERRSVRTERYKLIWRNGTYEEMFDLEDDAFEATNLLPVANLTAGELVAYDELVAAMENISDGVSLLVCPTTPDPACVSDSTKAAFSWSVRDGDKDRMKFKISGSSALTQINLGNPLAVDGTAYRFCVYDDGGSIVTSAYVDRAGDDCGGSDCWRTSGGDPPNGNGYKYKDKLAASDGIQTMRSKAGADGKPKFSVKGKGAALPDGVTAQLTAVSSVTLQLHGSDSPKCLSATVSNIGSQDADNFKAK